MATLHSNALITCHLAMNATAIAKPGGLKTPSNKAKRLWFQTQPSRLKRKGLVQFSAE